MAMVLETAARNAACNALVDLIDAGSAAGKLQFKTSAGTSVFDNNPVATLTFPDPAFGAASTGVATTSSALTSDTSAVGGTAAKAYFYDSDNTPYWSCAVGTSGSDINLSSVSIGAGDTVAVSEITVTVPSGA